MWVELVVGSHSCSEGFFGGFSSFPSSTKKNILNSKSTWQQQMNSNSVIN